MDATPFIKEAFWRGCLWGMVIGVSLATLIRWLISWRRSRLAAQKKVSWSLLRKFGKGPYRYELYGPWL